MPAALSCNELLGCCYVAFIVGDLLSLAVVKSVRNRLDKLMCWPEGSRKKRYSLVQEVHSCGEAKRKLGVCAWCSAGLWLYVDEM